MKNREWSIFSTRKKLINKKKSVIEKLKEIDFTENKKNAFLKKLKQID